MLDSSILNFPKEGTENVLVSLSSFFDVFVSSYCCCAPFKDKPLAECNKVVSDIFGKFEFLMKH